MRNYLLILFTVLIFVSISCSKENKNTSIDYQYGVNMTGDYASVQHLMINLSSTYFKVIYDSILFEDGNATIDEANVIYYPDSVYQVKISYPYWGHQDGYGNFRQGVIYLKADNGFFNSDYPVEVHFVNFNMDKDTINADSYIYTYMGETDGVGTFNLKVDNASRTFEDTTGTITFNADLNINVDLLSNSGFKTPDYLNFTGSMDGYCRNENHYNAQLTQAVTYDLSCNWMKLGMVELAYDGVDYYGNVFYSDADVCENWYNLVIEEISFPSKIIKPKWIK